jgi:sodium/potassium-transporting ATPase subunit alpha
VQTYGECGLLLLLDLVQPDVNSRCKHAGTSVGVLRALQNLFCLLGLYDDSLQQLFSRYQVFVFLSKIFPPVIILSRSTAISNSKLFNSALSTMTSNYDATDRNKGQLPATSVNDVEKQVNNPRIVWDDVDRRDGGRSHGRTARRRSRSQSRDSISSVRSRVQSVSGVPIGFRTLSIQVSESQAKAGEPPLKNSKATNDENKDYFGQLDYHLLSTKDVCDRFNVFQEQGLGQEAATVRLERDGKNSIPSPPEHMWKKIFWYVFGGFCSILWIGVIIFFICWRPLGDPNPAPYNLGLAILVLIVIFLQASFSAFQDWSTKRTMKSILDLLPSDAFVLRAGSFTKVPSTDVVAGDIVRISIGNKVPADIRLLSSSGDIRFDRSMITGEAEEVEGAVDSTDQNFLESRNISFMGTMVVNGSAVGIVLLTGKNSVMGRIAQATSGVEEAPTLIQREISRFVRIIVCLTTFLALLYVCTSSLSRNNLTC